VRAEKVKISPFAMAHTGVPVFFPFSLKSKKKRKFIFASVNTQKINRSAMAHTEVYNKKGKIKFSLFCVNLF
jgi:hypothetical protein